MRNKTETRNERTETMKRRRRTVELIGLNNDRVCCSAVKETGNWVCYINEDVVATKTMREAERELREIGLATKVLRCPELKT